MQAIAATAHSGAPYADEIVVFGLSRPGSSGNRQGSPHDVTHHGAGWVTPDVIGTTERPVVMTTTTTTPNDFDAFVAEHRPKLARVLNAHYGTELGPEALADALAYAWQHWDRVRLMDNPVGYLYRVGQSSLRKHIRWRRPALVLPEVNNGTMPDIEPGLPAALAALSAPQRTAVVLVHAHGWSLTEAADSMNIGISTLRNHLRRGLDHLRVKLDVELVGGHHV